MKYIFSILIAMLALMPVEAKKKTAVPAVQEKVYNFGIIDQKGGPVSHVFKIENTGDANLVILDAKADCGCTKPEYTEKPIAPGKSGDVKVTFQPLGQRGGFDKNVTVKTNGKPGKIVLRITGTVNPNK